MRSPQGRGYLPAGENVLRAFNQPLTDVRVLIVGQDPYPTPGHPIGLSFSVAPDVRPIPRSLQNIFRELVDDLGVPRPSTGDLSQLGEPGCPAAEQGAHCHPWSLGRSPRKGLGTGHRPGHPRPGGPRRPARGHPVGPGRAEPAPAARIRPQDRERSPQPHVGRPRVLRFPPFQPGQRTCSWSKAASRSTGACPTMAEPT